MNSLPPCFDTALKTGVAVGFRIEDSMFWGRLKELNTPENIESNIFKDGTAACSRLDCRQSRCCARCSRQRSSPKR